MHHKIRTAQKLESAQPPPVPRQYRQHPQKNPDHDQDYQWYFDRTSFDDFSHAVIILRTEA
jgi:hypothetical protein